MRCAAEVMCRRGREMSSDVAGVALKEIRFVSYTIVLVCNMVADYFVYNKT